MEQRTLRGPSGRLLPTYRLLTDPLAYYRQMFAEHGDPFLIHALNGDILLTANPDGAKEILSARPEIYEPFATEALGALVGQHSLLTLAGGEHRRQRKLIMPSFHGDRMKAYAETMVGAADRAFAALTPGVQFQALEVAAGLALEVIVRAVFGITEPARVREISIAVDDVVAKLKPAFFFSTKLQVAPLGLGPWAKFQRAAATYDQLLYDQIALTRAKPGGEDILSMLIAARDENSEAMTDQELRDELVTLVVAGHETTSVAIAWALYHLHRHPDVLAELRDELHANADVPPEELPRLPLLRATVQETLRIFPIVPDFIRTLNTPTEFMGHRMPAGSCVGVATTVMHHDAEIYTDPMRFNPHRFLGKRPPKWAYFPFGGGHRRCVGTAFAEFEIGLVLAQALSNYDFELLEPEELYPKRRNITLAPPTGVRMKITSTSPRV